MTPLVVAPCLEILLVAPLVYDDCCQAGRSRSSTWGVHRLRRWRILRLRPLDRVGLHTPRLLVRRSHIDHWNRQSFATLASLTGTESRRRQPRHWCCECCTRSISCHVLLALQLVQPAAL